MAKKKVSFSMEGVGTSQVIKSFEAILNGGIINSELQKANNSISDQLDINREQARSKITPAKDVDEAKLNSAKNSATRNLTAAQRKIELAFDDVRANALGSDEAINSSMSQVINSIEEYNGVLKTAKRLRDSNTQQEAVGELIKSTPRKTVERGDQVKKFAKTKSAREGDVMIKIDTKRIMVNPKGVTAARFKTRFEESFSNNASFNIETLKKNPIKAQSNINKNELTIVVKGVQKRLDKKEQAVTGALKAYTKLSKVRTSKKGEIDKARNSLVKAVNDYNITVKTANELRAPDTQKTTMEKFKSTHFETKVKSIASRIFSKSEKRPTTFIPSPSKKTSQTVEKKTSKGQRVR